MNKLLFSAALAAALAAPRPAPAQPAPPAPPAPAPAPPVPPVPAPPAPAAPPLQAADYVVKIVLGSTASPAGFGSGVMVTSADDLAVVVTCAHVINHQKDIFVYLPFRPANDRFVRVSRIDADFVHDVAYLLLDQRTLPWSLDVQPGFVPDVGPDPTRPQPVSTEVTGWSGDQRVDTVKGGFVAAPQDLVALLPASLHRALTGLEVLELRDANGTGDIVFGGDSGAPFLLNGKVVALAAGFVQVTQLARRRPFAVPLPKGVPGAADLTAVPPVSGPDVYTNLQVGATLFTALFEDDLGALTPATSLRPCMPRVRWLFGRYNGRANQLPASLGADPLGVTCSGYYQGLRKDKVALEDSALKESVLEAQAKQVRGGGAPTSGSDALHAQADDALKRYALTEPSVRGLLEGVGKAPLQTGPVMPPSKADTLDSLAHRFQMAASAARKQIKDLVTRGLTRSPAPRPTSPE